LQSRKLKISRATNNNSQEQAGGKFELFFIDVISVLPNKSNINRPLNDCVKSADSSQTGIFSVFKSLAATTL
jgi:hypothetical protein